jgi:signal transduction histidine kinase
MERDPEAARTTLGEAAGLAREALEELRALSRGIAPPVLADRGLAAALAALAARSPVPVELDVDLPSERLAPVAENTAYFVVSEALANVAKHSDAAACRVSVARDDGRLRIVVEDDGSGGAVLAPGHGLAGLADRLRAVDGTLALDSPRGGPTRLTAELP